MVGEVEYRGGTGLEGRGGGDVLIASMSCPLTA